MTIGTTFLQKKLLESDIAHHLPLLKSHAAACQHVTELGVRGVVSTWAFLAARPNKVVSIDWDREPFRVSQEGLEEARRLAKENGIEFEFRAADTTQIEIEPTDLLFIDTWHNYEQLLLELLMHSPNVRKWIIAHDTNERVFPGMFCAIEDFVRLNPHWRVDQRIDDFPGITTLLRIAEGGSDWGDFDRQHLLKEIEHQKTLYYEVILDDGPGGTGWRTYQEHQFRRFSLASRWPLANSK
jgi:hypothetical protein